MVPRGEQWALKPCFRAWNWTSAPIVRGGEIPQDLGRARTFLSVYLLGLRDATVKFADLPDRSQDGPARQAYEDLLGDLEQSFTAQRTHLLEDDRSALDIEIEVLRERLKQDGLVAR